MMHMLRALPGLLVALLFACSTEAEEWRAPELRLGLVAHDAAGKEQGSASLAAEVLFALPGRERAGDFQRLVPRLQLGAILNTAGRTSFAHAGFAWQVDLFGGLFAEAGLGLGCSSAKRSASATGSTAAGACSARWSMSRTGASARAIAGSRMWECAWDTSSEAAFRH